MRNVTEMTSPGPARRHNRLTPAFSRDELLSGAFAGGLDVDVMLERLFDSLPERRT